MKNQYSPNHAAWIFACSLLSLLCFNLLFAQSPADDFITITPENVGQLELGYVLPGFCGIDEANQDLAALWKVGVYDLLTGQRRFEIASEFGSFSTKGNYFQGSDDGVVNTHTGQQVLAQSGFISSDEKYVAAAGDGVYELANHKRLFPIDETGWFTPDSQLVAVYSDAIYEVKTGKQLFALPDGVLTFSPDSKYFAIWQKGVYETATDKQLITSSGTIPEFSPDSHYVSISEDGVYDLESKQKLIIINADARTSFSPDSQSIAITGDGLYDLATQKRRFKIGFSDYYPAHFFEDSQWLGLGEDGIYDLSTNEKTFNISSLIFSATQDASLITLYRKGIFETATGQLKFRIEDARFVAHDKLVISLIWTLDAPDSTFCAVYGVKGDKWSYRSGLVNTSRTQIYNAPNGDKRLDAQGRPLTTGRQLAVFAQTADKKWLRVADSTWVKISDVKPVALPEGIPVETP